MRNKETSLLLIAMLIGAQVIALGAQDKKKQDQSDIKLSTELVQIDVLVTDKNNKPVGGLTRDAFELYDNNKLQHVTNFSYEEIKATSGSETAGGERRLPREIGVKELKRVIAFVVDTLHIKFENLNRTKKMLSDFVDNKMQPGDLVLILPTGGGSGVLQQFTSDQRVLHRAIDRLRPFYFTNETTPFRSMTRSITPTDPRQSPAGVGERRSPPQNTGMTVGNRSDPLEEADARATLSALNETIKSMSKLPGRKVSVFMSEGIRTFSTETTSELRQTTSLAARANVVFYTIDPRGLEPLNLAAADTLDTTNEFETAVSDALNNKQLDFAESQDSLNAIALDTGGKFFRNSNDIARGLDQMLEENSAYYMLGFYPEAGKWDGKFHKVNVVVRDRADVTVSFRKGYLAKSPAPENALAGVDPKVAEAIEAINSPLARRDIDLLLTPLYIDNAQREPAVTLLLHIDGSKLNFAQTEGRYQTKLEEFGLVLDANGKAIDKIANTLDLNLQPQTYQAALKRGFVATRTIDVKPGTYQIKVLVREMSSGLIGTANDFIDIPNLNSGKLSASSLYLSGRAIEQGKVVDTAGSGGTPSQRRFQRHGQFTYSLVIYNSKVGDKDKQPQLEMKTRVLKGTRAIYTGNVRPVVAQEGSAPPFRIITGGVITLLSLTPDDYTLEVTVRDKLRKKEAVARREIDFSVE
jgi:VWFA-related protein